jgi:hypothetical protein
LEDCHLKLALGQNHETLSEKQPKAKRGGGFVQVVQCLPSEYKALNSNSIILKKDKQNKKITSRYFSSTMAVENTTINSVL